LRSQRSASSLIEAFDRCLAARTFHRHSPDELWNGVNDSRRRGSTEATGGLRSAPGVSRRPQCPKPRLIRRSSPFPRHSDTLLVAMTHPTPSVPTLELVWSQSVDQPQNFPKQFPRHRDGGCGLRAAKRASLQQHCSSRLRAICEFLEEVAHGCSLLARTLPGSP
jgi:hypothetical protein